MSSSQNHRLSCAQPSGVIRLRPNRGHSIHLGGPWYVQSWPDSGIVTYAEDHGTGVHSVPAEFVPQSMRLRTEGSVR